MTIHLFDILLGLKELKLGKSPVVIHSSLSSLGEVEGGAQTVVNACREAFPTLIVPTFTYKTMVIPLTGPPRNGIKYGSGTDLNRMAEIYTPEMPADPLMGIIAETVRLQPEAERSSHPILSFAGIHAGEILKSQTMEDPLEPLNVLQESNGWVVLLGVNHTVNSSIHYAEKLAGRRSFIRWALTTCGVVECPGFPGDSSGFEAIAPDLEFTTRRVKIGHTLIQAVPLSVLFTSVISRIKKDPLALLCRQEDCPRCWDIRELVLETRD
jgi:aminoglycoside 3-N-acetyltransferase